MRTSFHRQPEAQDPVPDYPIFWGQSGRLPNPHQTKSVECLIRLAIMDVWQ